MPNTKIPSGTIHKLPLDLRESLYKNNKARAVWGTITPLARNEFICWIISAKKTDTRKRRIKRTCDELKAGIRRPCCWSGCKHRDS